MKTINEQLTEVQKSKKIGLMTHVVVGYPSLKETVQLILDMEKAGVDFIELQIPFSDPLADGPTIMRANDLALEQGVTTKDCLEVMRAAARRASIPLLFMAYSQTLFHYGVDQFCHDAKVAGAQGLIVPDMPIDEESHDHFMRSCDKHKLHHIRLLSPTSTDARIKLNAKYQNVFVYCTSRNGVTGANNQLDPSLITYLDRVRQQIHVPLALGFGISKPEHIQALIGKVDVAVVGSAVIDLIAQKGVNEVPQFLHSLIKL